jgi:hypothetical protein
VKRDSKGTRGRLFGAVAVSATLLVPLAVFGGPALARSTAAASQYGHSASAQYQYRVQVCHATGSKKHPFVTITVDSHAVAAVTKHGGHVGPCTGTETPRPKHSNRSNHGHGKRLGRGHHHQGP